jgi:hypothetical protein
MKKTHAALTWIYDLISDDENPEEPHFDPVHLGGAVIITLTAIGCLYWLLWTLLVYEGGIFLKLYALTRLVFTSANLKDLGYEGYPYAMGEFAGIFGNFCALIISIVVVVAIRNLYLQAGRKHHHH